MNDTNEIRSLAIIPKTLVECTDLAKQLATSELLPKALRGKVPDVLMTIMAGQEMGLAPMASLRSIHVIEGKPVVSADGMVAIILGSGKAIYFDRIEESDTSVTYETLRVGSKTPRRCTWTLAMAKQAALHMKDNWRTYPRAMLASRAKAELARDVYPDVIAGCYIQDEADNFEQLAREPIARREPEAVDAEVVNEHQALAGKLAEKIAGAVTLEDLGKLVPEVAKLPSKSKEREQLRDAWGKRKDEITAALPPVEVAAS